MSNSDWMIYGASGYTGRLVAEEAVRQGMRPTLAGRSRETIEPLGRQLDCPTRVFDLGRHADVVSQLKGQVAVLSCAGPFSATAIPMMEACLEAGAHYLDVTGEFEVIESAHDRDQRAREAGVVLMPAVGFDVVPTDCLALALSKALPTATHLELAFRGRGTMQSPGTQKTGVESLPKGGRARIDGRIERVPMAWKWKEIPFRTGRQWSMTVPWGDVASAYYTTGIPNIETYVGLSLPIIQSVRRWRWTRHFAALAPVQWWLKRRVSDTVQGPTAEQRAAATMSLWGCASDGNGHRVEGTTELPDGYDLTMRAAVASVKRMITSPPPPGFQTPAGAFGENFVCELPHVDMQIAEPAE